jgi:serine/threonine protein kinase/formylglycine-generating enzyme required for sulfatase activity
MPIQTACPSCSVKISVKDELIGKAIKCPKCGQVLRIDKEPSALPATGEWQQPLSEATRASDTPSPGDVGTCSAPCPDDRASQTPADHEPVTHAIGRYRVEKILGEGGFGVVYLAHDDELKRQVAIKVPQAHRIRSPNDAEAYLVEAQILATLDHPHIVPVYDVGRSENGLPFVVSRFIEGCNLAERIKESRLSVRESVLLVARMAEALHYAHQHRLVHRDVKPGNILIDTSSKPFLVDFGLALKEEDFGKGGGLAGTPAYMSPEQANGEGHLVDGRSDIYSLGVVLFELLTGQRPFEAPKITQLLSLITSVDPPPLRQIDPAIPKELERIALKALAKKASERYATALDFAADLQHWLKPDTTTEKGPTSIKIIPKGLRSFDAEDTDFFLELLPGPRDRDGLPETLRFWKTRIEETNTDMTFRVGVIYGPSGCGKSSFVKAGLLPRLAETVRVVYVEATPDDTETRLMRGLEKACPDLAKNSSLRDAITHIRRKERPRQKVVLVVDQFEQWLHGKHNQENAELIQALRQCDGDRVQCIVMVRDDFWLAISRFMKNLEIRVVEGQNSALVDLFDPRHAQKVLTAFGTAYGTLPEKGVLTKDQETFLEKAVTGLAHDGKVITVRLALFAEMMKGKTWTPATLKEVGGTEGIGVTFLEETFSATTAPPEHRYHQNAARAVLNTLLPEQGTDIKGSMRSQHELLAASGYEGQPKDFDALLRILDTELRLITPTDPEGVDSGCASSTKVVMGQNYYQLTHDYLVPSLRDWLTRKQKETRRGRAELLLADRAAVWNARPENRQLPSLLQWASVRWLTQTKNGTPQQQKMMRKATKYHAVRGLIAAVLLLAGSLIGAEVRSHVIEQENASHAVGLVKALLNAKIGKVPEIIKEIDDYRKWADPLLKDANEKTDLDRKKKLHVSLALLPVDPEQATYIYDRLLEAEPSEIPVLRDALAPHKQDLVGKLWAVAERPGQGKESQRLRAACALAKYDPDGQRWANVQDQVANELVAVPGVFSSIWIESLQDVRGKLQAPLAVIFKNRKRRETERSLATDILADYAADQPDLLADLLMDADEKQFAILFPKFKDHGERGLTFLYAEVVKKRPVEAEDAKEKLAKRQANAAVALLRMNQPEKVWPLLKHSHDPRVRSYLIHRFHPLGADFRAIVKRLDEESDVTVRRALILSLGEFEEKAWSSDERSIVTKNLQEIYRTGTDPGLHAAAEWLLRDWKQDDWLRKINDDWAKDQEQRRKRLEKIKQRLAKEKEKAPPQWYVNSQGHTMVVIPATEPFLMGSPLTEAGRDEREPQHKMRIGRTFALAAKPVTMGQFLKAQAVTTREASFRKDATLVGRFAPTDDCPALTISWNMAAVYCNWLSKQEGMDDPEQWCYEIKENVPTLKKNYLSLSGYRLPTEAELEYATRAGALTSRYFGETDELLSKYAWYEKNSYGRAWPVGTLKPNDLGLFDVQGNVFTWCQDWYTYYPAGKGEEVTEDKEQEDGLTATGRVVRGSSFTNHPVDLRSAFRSVYGPSFRPVIYGFRVARTFTLMLEE